MQIAVDMQQNICTICSCEKLNSFSKISLSSNKLLLCSFEPVRRMISGLFNMILCIFLFPIALIIREYSALTSLVMISNRNLLNTSSLPWNHVTSRPRWSVRKVSNPNSFATSTTLLSCIFQIGSMLFVMISPTLKILFFFWLLSRGSSQMDFNILEISTKLSWIAFTRVHSYVKTCLDLPAFIRWADGCSRSFMEMNSFFEEQTWYKNTSLRNCPSSLIFLSFTSLLRISFKSFPAQNTIGISSFLFMLSIEYKSLSKKLYTTNSLLSTNFFSLTWSISPALSLGDKAIKSTQLYEVPIWLDILADVLFPCWLFISALAGGYIPAITVEASLNVS